jgi:hypothetical protein
MRSSFPPYFNVQQTIQTSRTGIYYEAGQV